MRGVALAVCVLGVFLLLFFGNLPGAKINSIEDVRVGQNVIFEGVVDRENINGNFHIMYIGGVSVVCHCNGLFDKKRVRVNGIIQLYNDKKQISAYSIEVLD